MYKKFLILIILVLVPSFCYSAEKDESQVLKIKFPEELSRLPKNSKDAAFEVIYKTAEVSGQFVQTSRSLLNQDLKSLSQGLENSTEKISKIISSEVKATLNDAITLGTLKSAFVGAIYQGYDLWKNDNPVGLLFIITGIIGFFWTQKFIDEFENTCNTTMGYLKNNLNKKQFKKLISYVMRRTFQEPINPEVANLLDDLKDEVALINLLEKRLEEKKERIQEEKSYIQHNHLNSILNEALADFDRSHEPSQMRQRRSQASSAVRIVDKYDSVFDE